MEEAAIFKPLYDKIKDPLAEHKTKRNLKNSELVKPDFDNELKHQYITLYQQDKSQINLNKYPGVWLLSIYSIENLNLKTSDKISVNIKGPNINYTSEMLQGNEFVKPNLFINFPLNSKKKIRVKLEINKHVGSSTAIFKTAYLEFDPDHSDNVDNEIIEHKLNLMNTHRITDSFKFWRSKESEDSLCRCYSTYISDSDFKLFRCMPSDFVSMCKWVIFRKNAFDLLFTDVVNVKSEETQYKWCRKNVKWFGFILILINDNDGMPESFLNLFNCEPVVENISKKAIRFRFDDKLIDIECTSKESFERCLSAACKNFPKLLNFFS